MDRTSKAIEFFRGNCNCAQSILSAFGDVTGFTVSDSKKIAAGFGGGIGKTQQICGALTGAVMVIGSKFYNENYPAESKRIVYDEVREFLKDFEKINGCIKCIELIGVDFSTEEGNKKAEEENLYELRCEKFIKDVCNMLEEIISIDN
jgi:C_GCAxxG_C_C family probable redox protein